jgi:hypothetical protein
MTWWPRSSGSAPRGRVPVLHMSHGSLYTLSGAAFGQVQQHDVAGGPLWPSMDAR